MQKIPEGYIPVPPVLLSAEGPLRVNVYVFLPLQDKLVHYLKKGDILPFHKLMEFSKINPNTILTTVAEEREALGEISKIISTSVDLDNINPEPAGEEAQHLIQSMNCPHIIDPALRQKVVQDIMDQASIIVTNVLAKGKGSDFQRQFEALMEIIKTDSHPIEIHQKRVAVFASLLLLASKDFVPQDLVDIASAALLHDIGLGTDLGSSDSLLAPARHVNGIEIEELTRNYFSNHLIAKFARHEHIDRGLRAIKENNIPLSDGAKMAIKQHHENFDGSGPQGVAGNRIFKLARYLRLADDIVCLINFTASPYDLKRAVEALKRINEDPKTGKPRYYDPIILASLVKLAT